MKTSKKVLSVLLAMLLAAGCFALAATPVSVLNVGDTIQFGNKPAVLYLFSPSVWPLWPPLLRGLFFALPPLLYLVLQMAKANAIQDIVCQKRQDTKTPGAVYERSKKDEER